MPKMMPCLWLDDRLEEAVNFYVRVFDGEVRNLTRPGGPGTPPLAARFRLKDQEFLALSYSREVRFTETISFSVECSGQSEVDRYWDALTADGGEEGMCGWLKDKYGMSWQIVPEAMDRTCFGPDPAGAKRATEAMLTMRRLIVADLERAYASA